MDEAMKKQLKSILVTAPPILFLGAGFSVGASNGFGEIPLGDTLKDEIIERFLPEEVSEAEREEISKYSLQEVCEYIDEEVGDHARLREYLKERFKNVEPAGFHYKLTAYPWKKIYTVNIDDLVERVYAKNGKKLLIQNQKKEKEERADTDAQYIKLHGCVAGDVEDMVFSSREYKRLINGMMNFKLNSLVFDIQRENFIFIGASMDEPDIDHYITQYENAGYFRQGKMIFVEPYPKLKLKNRIKRLSGILVESTAKDFLDFLTEVNYDPDEQQKQKNRLNYSGIFVYDDIIKDFDTRKVYESRLYEGYDCKWQDVVENWLFESPFFDQVKKDIDAIDFERTDSYCYSIYGKRLSGKACMLKQIGAYLNRKAFTVFEYRGKQLDINVLFDYMRNTKSRKFVLLIEDASYYYKVIEKIFQQNDTGKKLLVITTSRNYDHRRKRYYLEGNPFKEYQIDDRLNLEYARRIYAKLSEKGYLGKLSLDVEKGSREIQKYNVLANVFIEVTYGKGFEKRVRKSFNDLMEQNNIQIIRLFRELTLFEKTDLSYYPSEMLTARYSVDFNCFAQGSAGNLSPTETIIVDFVRANREGIALKNKMLLDQIWDKTDDDEKVRMIRDILRYISSFVSEKKDNYWRIIFESLLKEDTLEKTVGLTTQHIVDLYYQLKQEYGNISYYWLQMGIVEQRRKDFAKALNHLLMAKSIRPFAYQIQHAIARNYLKQANFTNDPAMYKSLFAEGERQMLDLINSQEYHKDKAKCYSIHCYIFEEIKYIEKHNISVTNNDIRQMKRFIDRIRDIRDDYIDNLLYAFMKMLKEHDKLEAITFKLDDQYWKALNKNKVFRPEREDEDVLVDSY
ncbi:MAG: SIR2 family protein [Lachnospiraceae bacterium]|nr:SIR2 family protein [Lachnospiraceae bacterium]